MGTLHSSPPSLPPVLPLFLPPTMSCCPPGSLSRLGQGAHTPRGQVYTKGDLPIYIVGEGPNCILWNYDIHGFDGGRTKEICDLVAEAGFMVVFLTGSEEPGRIQPNLGSRNSWRGPHSGGIYWGTGRTRSNHWWWNWGQSPSSLQGHAGGHTL